MLVALDISKAFDTFNHTTLFEVVERTALRPILKHWIINYMCESQSYVEFRNNKSKPHRVKQGFLQGGVISPELFNLYLSKIPCPLDGIVIVTYADDSTIKASIPNVDICVRLNNYHAELAAFFHTRNMKISATKLNVDHLHEQTRVLPVRQHNHVLSLQYLLRCE